MLANYSQHWLTAANWSLKLPCGSAHVAEKNEKIKSFCTDIRGGTTSRHMCAAGVSSRVQLKMRHTWPWQRPETIKAQKIAEEELEGRKTTQQLVNN